MDAALINSEAYSDPLADPELPQEKLEFVEASSQALVAGTHLSSAVEVFDALVAQMMAVAATAVETETEPEPATAAAVLMVLAEPRTGRSEWAAKYAVMQSDGNAVELVFLRREETEKHLAFLEEAVVEK